MTLVGRIQEFITLLGADVKNLLGRVSDLEAAPGGGSTSILIAQQYDPNATSGILISAHYDPGV